MDEELAALLSMGSDEEAIAELLRQKERQEALIDETRGREYGTQAGRVYVANPWQAVSDVFTRGKAEHKAKGLDRDIAVGRRKQDTQVEDILNMLRHGTTVPPIPVTESDPLHRPEDNIQPKGFEFNEIPGIPPPPAARPVPTVAAPGAPPAGGGMSREQAMKLFAEMLNPKPPMGGPVPSYLTQDDPFAR
jgi:hypothetical protein